MEEQERRAEAFQWIIAAWEWRNSLEDQFLGEDQRMFFEDPFS
ncbi:MAG: hypothetical protein QXJ39_06925 [Candidatus Korarchaeum sp.]